MIFKDLKKILSRSILIFILVFLIDRGTGWWLQNAFYSQKHGDDLVSIHVIDKGKEDILILGGSRASHHYVAGNIERETGMTCFNGGRDNMDIIYISAILDIVTTRYYPKIIVLDMLALDLADYGHGRKTNIQRTSTALLPFAYKYPKLYATILLADQLEKIKATVSHIYPYNSLVATILQNTYTNLGHQSVQGYEPLYRHIDSNIYKEPLWGRRVNDYPLDSECVRRLQHVIEKSKDNNIRLIAIVSPSYFSSANYETTSLKTLKKMIEENGFEYYDFSLASPFHHNPWFFDDDMHLNDSGAVLFSKTVANVINSKPGPTTALPGR